MLKTVVSYDAAPKLGASLLIFHFVWSSQRARCNPLDDLGKNQAVRSIISKYIKIVSKWFKMNSSQLRHWRWATAPDPFVDPGCLRARLTSKACLPWFDVLLSTDCYLGSKYEWFGWKKDMKILRVVRTWVLGSDMYRNYSQSQSLASITIYVHWISWNSIFILFGEWVFGRRVVGCSSFSFFVKLNQLAHGAFHLLAVRYTRQYQRWTIFRSTKLISLIGCCFLCNQFNRSSKW